MKCGYLWLTGLGLGHFGTLSVPNLEEVAMVNATVTIQMHAYCKAY